MIIYLSVQDPNGLSRENRWVYKMQDASAKYPRMGLLEGHQHFPGNFQSCLEIKTNNSITGDGKHCMMVAAFPTLGAKEEKFLTQEELRRTYQGFEMTSNISAII